MTMPFLVQWMIDFNHYNISKRGSQRYLESSQTSTMKDFCGTRERLKANNYFRKKNSIADVRLGSRYA